MHENTAEQLMPGSKASGEPTAPRRKAFCFQAYGAPVGLLPGCLCLYSPLLPTLPPKPPGENESGGL